MKKFYVLSLSGALAVLTAQAQTTPSTSTGTAGTATGGNNTGSSLPPTTQQGDRLAPGSLSGTNTASQTSTMSLHGTNRLSAISAPGMVGTNASQGQTRSSTLTPTSRNTSSSTNTATDREPGASTPSTSPERSSIDSQSTEDKDHHLLMTIRQKVSTEISSVTGSSISGGSSGALPINYVVRGGVVQLVGEVPTEEQKERIEVVVQEVPGVTRVENNLQVTATAARNGGLNGMSAGLGTPAGAGATAGSSSDNTVGSGTSTGAGSSLNPTPVTAGVGIVSTNRLSPTSSTTNNNTGIR